MRKLLILFTCCFLSLFVFAQSQFDIGVKFFENKEYERAILTFESYLQSNSTSYAAHSYLYKSYLSLNRVPRCYKVSRKSCQVFSR